MRNDEHWRFEVYRDRVKRSLVDRYPVRRHMAIVVLVAIAAGLAFNALLVAAGSKPMLGRYVAAILVGHATFVAGIGFWLAHSGVAELATRGKAHLLVGDDVAPPEPWKPVGAGEAEIEGDPIFVMYFLGTLMAITVVFLTLGGWALVVAPSIFGDAVLARIHAAGLLKGVRTVARRGWIASVLRHMGFTLAFGLAAAFAIDYYAKVRVPGANSLWEVL